MLIDQAGAKALVPASVMKIYSLATALDSYGADYRFRTPVYRLGEVKDGVLDGDLVLVASGDFSFGLREQPDGTLAFNSLPEVDHNSTYTGFPGGAHVKNSNPLAALDALAAQVKAAGVGGDHRRRPDRRPALRDLPRVLRPGRSLRSGSTRTSSTSR